MDIEQQKKDHDTLVEIKTILNRLVEDVAEIKSNTVGRIEDLEIKCATKVELEHAIANRQADIKRIDAEISNLKMWKNWLMGTTSVVTGVATFLAIALWNHLLGK